MLIAAGIMIYIYHEVIIQTLIYMLIAVGIIAGTAGVVAFTISTFRWQRRRSQAAITGALRAQGVDTSGIQFGKPGELPVLPEQDQMNQAADTLADEGVELEWNVQDGTLRAKKD
jgi:hypothetical protein